MESHFGNSEILLIADSVAREKNIPKESVIEALEEAIRVAARRKYGQETSIKAEVDRKNGEIRIFRQLLVVDPSVPVEEKAEVDEDPDQLAEEPMQTISIADAVYKKADAKIGEILLEPLPPIDLGRVAAQSAKQVITNKVREIERAKQFDEFKDRVGQIISGVIEKIEYGNVIVKLGQNYEGVIKRENMIKGERVGQGDRIRALVVEVNKENRGPQILLSRAHDEFLAALFTQEVPEIYDGLIEIKAIARDTGSRAKIAVYSSDKAIDPVGSCVGMRGARVQAVINELHGEKIDIINWSSDMATMVVNALAPAEATKVIIDEDRKRVEVVIPDEQLSIAIGKRGQNVRLASKLIGWEIDIMTEQNESKRRSDEFNAITEKFMAALDVEEILAQLLASEGYSSIQDIADAAVTDVANIQGLDEGIAQELINRAKEYAETHTDAGYTPDVAFVDPSRLDQRIVNLPGMTPEIASLMHISGIEKLEELADLAHDEFVEKLPQSGLSDELINEFIMAARNIVFFHGK